MNKSGKTGITPKYVEETDYKGYLEHYFGNYIGSARIWIIDGDLNRNFNERKSKFIMGLEQAIKLNLPEKHGVTRQNLIEMLELVRMSDLSKMDDINNLYALYNKIKHKSPL